ncbi:heat shock transcription factor, Y-linked-like [Pogoniulus pusillus]|uniref:heat shock transcription factor, Y-linked-like n=1 Tax=Pogoniulus pusillus TaxID=488313 RepID=UPI0030B96D59
MISAASSGQGETAPHGTAIQMIEEEWVVQSENDRCGTRELPSVSNNRQDRANESFLSFSFPQKLWEMLESDQLQSVWWSNGGKCVAINKEFFKEEVLEREEPPQIFAKKSMKHFLQQMKLYGLSEIQQDSQRSASLAEFLAEEEAFSAHSQVLYYYSPSFNQEHPHLLERCKRKAGVKRRALNAVGLNENFTLQPS